MVHLFTEENVKIKYSRKFHKTKFDNRFNENFIRFLSTSIETYNRLTRNVLTDIQPKLIL